MTASFSPLNDNKKSNYKGSNLKLEHWTWVGKTKEIKKYINVIKDNGLIELQTQAISRTK